MPKPWGSLLLPLALLGGCAGPMGPIRPNPPPAPPVLSFDGSYQTVISLNTSFGAAQSTPWCNTPGQPIVTIKNGQFTYAVPHPNYPDQLVVPFSAEVAQDGSFQGQAIEGSIAGRIEGGHIVGRLDGSACIYTFTGNRI